MRVLVLALAILSANGATVAMADVAVVKGTFVGPGTYATAEGCEKLAAIAAGGDRNVGSVPETLTEDGFLGWEGSCTFTSFTEIEKNKKWKALMHCSDGPEEGPESDIFERLPDETLKVSIMDSPTIFQRCDADKGK
jgi:hypothetical protein